MVVNIVLAIGILCLIAHIVAGLFQWREDKVRTYRNRLVSQIIEAIEKDLDLGETNNGWRFEKYNEVTYDQMLRQFWKPLNSFYKDTSFLRPTRSDSK